MDGLAGTKRDNINNTYIIHKMGKAEKKRRGKRKEEVRE